MFFCKSKNKFKEKQKINLSIMNNLVQVLYSSDIENNKYIDIKKYPKGHYLAKVKKGTKTKIYKLIFN